MREMREIRRALTADGWKQMSTSRRLYKKNGVSIYLGHEDGDDGGMDAKDAQGHCTAWTVEFNADTPAHIVVAAARAAVLGDPETTP